jgi:hypothetical protein
MATAATTPRHLGRFRCSDAVGVRSVRVRDQEEPEEENGGKLMCRIVEDRNGGLHVLDAGARTAF